MSNYLERDKHGHFAAGNQVGRLKYAKTHKRLESVKQQLLACVTPEDVQKAYQNLVALMLDETVDHRTRLQATCEYLDRFCWKPGVNIEVQKTAVVEHHHSAAIIPQLDRQQTELLASIVQATERAKAEAIEAEYRQLPPPAEQP
jgi:hypothetical protein